MARRLVAQGGAYAFLKSNDGQVFDVALPDGGSAVAATVRVVDLNALQSAETGGLLPAAEAPSWWPGRSAPWAARSAAWFWPS